MQTSDTDTTQTLLEQEERALALKKSAIKTASAALEARRKADDEARTSLEALRALGFPQRDLTKAFALTSAETAALFPRKRRRPASAPDGRPDPADHGGHAVDDAAQ